MRALLDISVIVPTRDRPEWARSLPARLAACRLDGVRAELIVVDDGSLEPVAPLLAGTKVFGEPVTLLRQGRFGPARARNAGARVARGRRLLFFADDLEAGADWLVRHARSAGAEALASPILVGPIDPPAAGDGTPFDRFVWREGIHFDVATVAREGREAAGVAFERFYASNASLPRERFFDVGGFDEGFPMAAWEDVELAHRLRATGARIGFDPAARARALPGSGTTLDRYLRWREAALPSAYRAMRLAPPLIESVARRTRPRWRGVGHETLWSAVRVLAALDHRGVALPRTIYRRLLGHFQPLWPPPPAAETPVRAGRVIRDPIDGRARFDSRRSDSVIATELLLRALARFRGRFSGRVLDLGCGDGPLRAPLWLPTDGYVGVDRAPSASAAGVRADVARLPFAAASFDGVVIAEVLEHVRAPGDVLAEAMRVAKPGADLLVTAPFFYRIHDEPEDRWRFTEDGLTFLVREAGFEVREVRMVGGAGSVVADLVARNLATLPGEALSALGRRLGIRAVERAGGSIAHRSSVLAQRGFLAMRSVTLAIATRKGRIGPLARFLWDRSSRMAKGFVVFARKPAP